MLRIRACSTGREAMTNDKRLAVYMYFVSREAMREGVEILNNLGYRYTEHPEAIDEADTNTTFVEAWKPLPADDVVFADEDKVSSAAIHEINHAIGRCLRGRHLRRRRGSILVG